MNKIEFEKILNTSLTQYDFEYKNKAYYCRNDELIIVINAQKSNYDHSFYINYGFLIKESTPKIDYPKMSVCDVQGRFAFHVNHNIVYTFSLEENTVEQLETTIMNGVNSIILPVLQKGLSKYFEIFPQATAMISLHAKKAIGLN